MNSNSIFSDATIEQYFESLPLERRFVINLSQCIRQYNIIHNPTPSPYPLSDKAKAEYEKSIKELSITRKQIEMAIGEKYNLNFYQFKRTITELYNEMNAADAGFEPFKGSPMQKRLDEFVAKFTASIKAIANLPQKSDGNKEATSNENNQD